MAISEYRQKSCFPGIKYRRCRLFPRFSTATAGPAGHGFPRPYPAFCIFIALTANPDPKTAGREWRLRKTSGQVCLLNCTINGNVPLRIFHHTGRESNPVPVWLPGFISCIEHEDDKCMVYSVDPDATRVFDSASGGEIGSGGGFSAESTRYLEHLPAPLQNNGKFHHRCSPDNISA